eukprot:SAG31_NODE_26961_length_433_cov_1.317365_2_plen_66_part_01
MERRLHSPSPTAKRFLKGVHTMYCSRDRFFGAFRGTHRVYSSEILDPNLQLHTSRIEQRPALVAWH